MEDIDDSSGYQIIIPNLRCFDGYPLLFMQQCYPVELNSAICCPILNTIKFNHVTIKKKARKNLQLRKSGNSAIFNNAIKQLNLKNYESIN